MLTKKALCLVNPILILFFPGFPTRLKIRCYHAGVIQLNAAFAVIKFSYVSMLHHLGRAASSSPFDRVEPHGSVFLLSVSCFLILNNLLVACLSIHTLSLQPYFYMIKLVIS